jgi:two-component system response regulator
MISSENTANFTESMSALRHDLRTPINAIIGYSEMLMEDLVDEKESDFFLELQELNAGGYDLLSTINKYLQKPDNKDISSLEEFTIFFESMKVHAAPSLEKVIKDCKKLKQIETTPEVSSDIERVSTAVHRLEELMNTGISYPKAQVMEEIRSINLPEIKTGHEINTGNYHIIIVDDNDNNRDLFTRQLEREGYKVSVALDGLQGLEMIKTKEYDLVLLDLLMPNMNGYQVLQHLKEDSELREIPVIMISASDEIDTVIQCLKLGAEDYLPKPSNQILLKARIGTALEKTELRQKEIKYLKQINGELDKGRNMQLNFLPQEEIEIEGWGLQGFFRPAYELAGDFYDSFVVDEDNLAIVIADVCDKGVGAALFMAVFRSLIRLYSRQIYESDFSTQSAKESIVSREDILNAMRLTNEYVAEYHASMTMFATMFFAVINIKTGEVNYINGGHEPVYILNSQGEILQILKRSGMAVGIMPGANFKIMETQLNYGDTLLGFTDGVTDAKSEAGQFFAMEGLLNIAQQPIISVQDLIGKVVDSLTTHIGQAQQFDDITMIAVQRLHK